MYRVAIILNESELLRSGYANVAPKLRKLSRLSQYTFDSFTVVNIKSLFEDTENSLKDYDSLVITTNATSDVSVLEVLRKNRPQISDFLDDGKGIFIASQKKLSTVSKDKSLQGGMTEFLPPYYDFCTMERPKTEWDSGIGHINTDNSSQGHLLLEYPESVSARMVTNRCKKNEFRRHFYRSHLIPETVGAYQPLLTDNLTDKDNARMLLIASQSPQKQERVVISTIAIDWEFHEHLLTNILVYITEGSPQVAFIKKPGINDGDYEFLLSNALLSKVPHIVYNNIADIPAKLRTVHCTYIFSPGWPESDIFSFLRNSNKPVALGTQIEKTYRIVYYFQRHEDLLTMTQHSNCSTVDLIIDRSASWLKSKFDNRMWGRSFWITHDILFMGASLDINISEFIKPVLQDIQEHYRDGSYDGVMGATCGLLELILLLHKYDQSEYEASGFGEEATHQICNWILNNVSSQTIDDQRTALLALSRQKNELIRIHGIDDKSMSSVLEGVLEGMLRDIDRVDMASEHITEVELCRFIEACLMHGQDSSGRISKLLHGLSNRQATSGAWSNIGRTAHVLVFLLDNLDSLKVATDSSGDMARCENMIYNGVLYLRTSYDWDNANWNDDLQATAKASHAIGLGNKKYEYSTQEFLDTLKGESETIQSANLIRTLGNRLNTARNQVAVTLGEVSELKAANDRTARLLRVEPLWRHLAFCLGALLIGLSTYLLFENRKVLVDAIKSISILSMMAGLVVGLVAGWFNAKMAAKKK